MSLPVRSLTLYKHGIAVVERGGAVEGAQVTLTFHRDQMNDVLKSLVAWDRAGGQVQTIAYDAPEEREQKLQRGSIRLSDHASLVDLLRDLRGRAVRVTVDASGADDRTVTGTVVGLDTSTLQPDESLPLVASPFVEGRVSLLTEAGIEVLRLRDIMGVTILDEQARADLDFFLRLSTAEADQRTVTLRLSEGSHDLAVRYLTPSPTWRVSYRLVGEKGDADERRALVQGWGIFDNPFDEALEEVRVSLVAGMPISFIYDLYTPFTPQRPEVKEEARVAAAPVEMERARFRREKAAMAPPAPAPMMAMARGAAYESADMAEAAPPSLQQSLAGGTMVAASGEAQGDLFEYRIGPPVTVQRGEAAMVPILSTEVPYRKEHVYNGQKMPKHPTVVLRFDNTSELTLERGPITVVEGDAYIGEAIFPFSRPNAEVQLAVAVDLGVSVREERRTTRDTYALRIENGLMVFQEHLTQRTTYEVANTNAEAVELTIEHPRTHGYTPFDMPNPDERTDNFYRWRVPVPAGPEGTATFGVEERQETRRSEHLSNLTQESLAHFLRNRWLDQALANELRAILDLYAEKQRLGQRVNEIEGERNRLLATQEQARKNMGGLKESGDEGKLRSRYVRQLNEAEDTLARFEGERTRLKQQDDALNARLQAATAALR